jgi:cystathionine beta-synthase
MVNSTNVIDLIGNTPIVKINKFDTGPCDLFLKLETQNPGGSIKDRIALSMIQDAEKKGILKPGGTIIEATAGNTGLGLALVSAIKGYKLILVIPDKMSREKMLLLRAMGAEIIITRSDVGKGHPQYYQDLAQKISNETKDSFYVNQFANPANVLAHETTTGPEIWEQMEGKVDAVVCGVGSGGTISGLSRFFAKTNPATEIVLADPVGSILVHYIETGELLKEAGSWMIEGIGEDFIPVIADLSRVKKAYSISDKDSFDAARELLKHEGILGGSSSGTLFAAALKYCREQTTKKRVITFICDSGNKYLSKMYNDYWMLDQGFIEKKHYGDLRDIISRMHSEGATITLSPDDTLNTAFARMKLYDISQIPVVVGKKIVGIIDETDLLMVISANTDLKKKPVKEIATGKLETLDVKAKLEDVFPIFEKGFTVIVEEEGEFLGIITQLDVVNFLKRKVQ